MFKHLKGIFVAGAAACATANGAIIYSGVQNLVIPADFAGIYIDFQDADDATLTGTATGASAAAVPGWDFNLFFGGAAIGSSTTAHPVTDVSAPLSTVQNLPVGTIVDGTDTFPTGFSGSTGHMTSEFTGGSEGWIGFSIPNSSWTSNAPGVTVYGGMRVTLNDDGSPGTIHDWFWDNSGAAIAIPEPSTVVPLVALLTPWVLRRRRRAR